LIKLSDHYQDTLDPLLTPKKYNQVKSDPVHVQQNPIDFDFHRCNSIRNGIAIAFIYSH
jgi:hypothetical protein